MKKCLVAGCGLRPKKSTQEWEYLNLDCCELPGVDIVFDLNLIGKPLPFVSGIMSVGAPKGVDYTKYYLGWETGSYDRVEAEDVLEHVENPIAVVQEFGRVLKPGGVLWIRGPDGAWPEVVWADLTHKRAFSLRSFDGFDPDTYDGKHYGYYHGTVKFRVLDRVSKNKGLEFTLEKR